MKKLLVICGPTAVGKTALGIKLAKKLSSKGGPASGWNGEIISADSRQVYKGMDIVTGKDLPMLIPIWGLDLVKPDQEFSVAHWLKFAHKIIQNIWMRKKLPIIVGGTGFWIKALIDRVDSMGIPPDWKMREKLSNLDIKKLRRILAKLNPKRLQKMNRSDRNNPRRLIRAIEIAKNPNLPNFPNLPNTRFLLIGLKASNKYLYKQIDKRVEKRIKQGAQEEIETLIKKGYSWNLPAISAIGYKEWQPFLENKASLDKVIQHWKYNEHAYARRQMTWFRKNKKIKWFNIENADWEKDIVKLAKRWYYYNNGKN